jgi:hypothetical protein
MRCRITLPMILLVHLVGCSGNSSNGFANSNRESQSPEPAIHTEGQTMKLTSTAFSDGAAIPEKHTGVGQDLSPALAWSNLPEGTGSLALICDDPDAPSRAKPRAEGPWVHWVMYNIPPELTELPEGVPRKAVPAEPEGARQGVNDFGSDNVGYRGPMPPKGSGPHRYFFKIYALDAPVDLAPRAATKKSLLAAIEGHILAEDRLMGVFERK